MQSAVNSTSDTKATDLKSSEMRADSFAGDPILQASPEHLGNGILAHSKTGTFYNMSDVNERPLA